MSAGPFALVLPLVLAIAIGGLAALALWPAPPRAAAERLCVFFAGLGLGPGLVSALYYVWCFVLGFDHSGLPWVETAIAALLALACVLIHRGRAASKLATPADPVRRPSLAWAFWIMLLLCGAAMLLLTINRPHGEWDSWVIWNQRARMLILGKQCFFMSMPYANHGDYPLLIPAFIARCWNFIGGQTTTAPAATAFVFSAATAGLIMSAIRLTRGRNQAYIAGLFLFGAYFFVRMCVRQYADVPLAFNIMACLLLLCLQETLWPRNRSLLLLAGLFAGLAAWTKNEGSLFVLALACGLALRWLFCREKRNLAKAGWVFAAALPILIVIQLYNTKAGVPSDLFIGGKLKSNLLDANRYVQVFTSFVQEWRRFRNWSVLPYLLLLWPLATRAVLAPGARSGLTTAVATIVFLNLGYFAVYIITPHDLTIHLATSLERLYVHLWPSILFLVLYAFVEAPRQTVKTPK